MMSPTKARKGGKNVLVILLASKGQREFEDAYDVFKDLFAKVAPSTVVAAQLKPESGNASEVEFPPGLDKLCRENNVDKRGCLIKSITNEDGSDNHWSAYYPEITPPWVLGKRRPTHSTSTSPLGHSRFLPPSSASVASLTPTLG